MQLISFSQYHVTISVVPICAWKYLLSLWLVWPHHNKSFEYSSVICHIILYIFFLCCVPECSFLPFVLVMLANKQAMKPVWEHTLLPPAMCWRNWASLSPKYRFITCLISIVRFVSQPVIKSINGNNVFIYLWNKPYDKKNMKDNWRNLKKPLPLSLIYLSYSCISLFTHFVKLIILRNPDTWSHIVFLST